MNNKVNAIEIIKKYCEKLGVDWKFKALLESSSCDIMMDDNLIFCTANVSDGSPWYGKTSSRGIYASIRSNCAIIHQKNEVTNYEDMCERDGESRMDYYYEKTSSDHIYELHLKKDKVYLITAKVQQKENGNTIDGAYESSIQEFDSILEDVLGNNKGVYDLNISEAYIPKSYKLTDGIDSLEFSEVTNKIETIVKLLEDSNVNKEKQGRK